MKALTFLWTQFVGILNTLIFLVGIWAKPEIHTSNILALSEISSWQICIPSLAVKETWYYQLMLPSFNVQG